MTIQDISSTVAEVNALGTAQNATVNFSGALMEMLATTYSHILMAAVRESIQNACDAARREGYSFSEGVHVSLPTQDNPMLVVQDSGAGMSDEFMFDTYLSFGSSTKSGDDGAVGGLGVGRWAAYGYIRECLITTTTADDLIERTYFQFQSEDNMPQVQLAGKGPGSHVGTSISFPVKESDFNELYKAVKWLQEIMQITMNDSFSVDKPDLLQDSILPAHSETIFDLGEFDETLEGVRVHPMMGAELQYERGGFSMKSGSLIVMTNKEAGVGGLPFHVTSSSRNSLFFQGSIIEIPMRFNIPFMPSREEVKYTDSLEEILDRIDAAAILAATSRVKELYFKPCLDSKRLLSQLLGIRDYWNLFSQSNGSGNELGMAYREILGGSVWRDRLPVPVSASVLAAEPSFRYILEGKTLRGMEVKDGELYIQQNGSRPSMRLEFSSRKPVTLVFNDLKSGGISRLRNWMKEMGEAKLKHEDYVFIETVDFTKAEEVARQLSSVYNNELPLLPVSSMPAIARRVVGGRVVGARRGSRLTVFNVNENKQISVEASFTKTMSEPRKFWVTKEGADIAGFSSPITDMSNAYSYNDIKGVLKHLNADNLYLLTPRQTEQLHKEISEAQADGYFDMSFEDFEEMEDGDKIYREITALKSWVPFHEGIKTLFESEEAQKVFKGEVFYLVSQSYDLETLCNHLAESPRFSLSGTKFDEAISPFVDIIAGEVKLIKRYDLIDTPTSKLCQSLEFIKNHIDADFSEDHAELVSNLKELKENGYLDYRKEYEKIVEKFPLLSHISFNRQDPDIEDVCQALALLYG